MEARGLLHSIATGQHLSKLLTMKNFIIALIIIVSLGGMLVLTSCNYTFNGKGHKGNGTIVTEERHAMPFTTLDIEGVFPVVLSQDGGKEWVKVEADENLQDIVIVENNNGTLSISTEDGAKVESEKMKVYVNVKNLQVLNYKSIGALNTKDTLKLDSLQLNSDAVGKLNLAIEADFIRTNLNNVGSTTLKGIVREARINNKSVGALNAFGLKAGTLMIHNTAVGTAEVYADSAFYIRSSAIGSLTYKGPGVVKELTSEGVGKVSKLN